MKKVIVRGIFAVAFFGLSMTGFQGISIHGHELLGESNSAMAMMKADGRPKPCRPDIGDYQCF